MHLKKNGSLQKSFFSPQSKLEDGVSCEAGISVVRRAYSRLDFIKKHCKCNENALLRRAYHGLARIKVSDVRTAASADYCANIFSTPENYAEYRLPQHADILYGYVPVKGTPLPVSINLIIEQLLVATLLEVDPDPNARKWTGSAL